MNFFVAVLQRSRVMCILPLYALNWSMLAVYEIPTHNAIVISLTEMVQWCVARFVYNDYSRFSHGSPILDALGWDSFEHCIFANQMCVFCKIYKRACCFFLHHLRCLQIWESGIVATVHFVTNLAHQVIQEIWPLQCSSQKILLEGQSGHYNPFSGAWFVKEGSLYRYLSNMQKVRRLKLKTMKTTVY